MQTLIWGAGAIGGTLGAYLARAGHDITLVDADADHVRAISESGIRIVGPIAEFSVRVPAFTPNMVFGTWDSIVLATKAHHTEVATRALSAYLGANGCVVSAQNGLNELTIAAIVGRERTVGAFVNFGADYLEPGVVHYGGRGAVVVGELDGAMTARAELIRATWRDFDDAALVTDNIWGYLWGKEAYGAMLFATALTNESIADVLGSPEYRDVFIALAREALSVAAARGVKPESFDGFSPAAFSPGASVDAARRSLDALVAHNRKSAKTHSGIWRDLAVRKRRTEVDAQLGIIVTLGCDAGVRTPLIARLVELIHDIEAGKREQSRATLDELSSLARAHG